VTSCETVKREVRYYELGIMGGASVRSGTIKNCRPSAYSPREREKAVCRRANTKGVMKMNTRNEIKAIIVREGMTMSEVVEKMAEQYGWSASVPNLSGKLRRGSLRYHEAVELADALGYDLIWQKRKERR